MFSSKTQSLGITQPNFIGITYTVRNKVRVTLPEIPNILRLKIRASDLVTCSFGLPTWLEMVIAAWNEIYRRRGWFKYSKHQLEPRSIHNLLNWKTWVILIVLHLFEDALQRAWTSWTETKFVDPCLRFSVYNKGRPNNVLSNKGRQGRSFLVAP